MTHRRWALVAWGAFLIVLIGVAAMDGGRNCQVPNSGLFHRLMNGEKFVETHSWRFRCAQVK